ncbi:MAG: DUF87 domain-containing protein [Gemmatimonadales bacterium]|nr:DUF87 domain-containing protein [Gemmatimonadales bacterium]
MDDYEKLGAFYLGRRYDLAAGERTDDLVLVDAKDLTTHAVVIGMTGSGKTGLAIGMLEEAAIDRIPVIAIDPKGDLGNLLLTFPGLTAEEFAPWINAQDAATAGKEPAALAAETAERWRKGLAEWGQPPERIARLREAADFAIYTPGSTAGRPLSVLKSFAAPPPALRDDRDLFRERIQTTATSVLALLGVEADPLTSREHILVSTLLQKAWGEGRDLDVPALIQQIQQPPVRTIGVMDIDQVFPAKERFAFAMQLNNLLAAPGFEAWMEGEPLDAASLLYSPSGKPRVSVLSIAHLGDAERMFFVAMLLNSVIGWMRQQPGTGSLRAILYMDELFGYLPPTANPPTKPLFLTLLKQARAFGLGVVLSTQNPVDLDYKALSNAGIWCIGRLQTERDKARVMEGLEGAAAGGAFDKAATERILAGLGKRVFYLHSVHARAPVVFQTRWTLAYLGGPLTREQIRRLVPTDGAAPTTAGAGAAGAMRAPLATEPREEFVGPPAIAPGIPQYFLPVAAGEGDVVLHPHALGVADVTFSNAKARVDRTDRVLHLAPFADGPVALDWGDADGLVLALEAIGQTPPEGMRFAPVPPAASQPKAWPAWGKAYEKWLRGAQQLVLWRSPSTKLVSGPGETEAAFRARLQHANREVRDAAVEKLRAKYASKAATLQERLRRAEAAVAREQQEASAAKVDTAMAVGGALLGALLGRRAVSATSLSRVGTAVRGAGRASKQAGDVERAAGTAEAVRQELAALEQQVQDEVAALDAGFDAQQEVLEEIAIKPKAGGIHVHAVGLAWAPFRRTAQGGLEPAWE